MAARFDLQPPPTAHRYSFVVAPSDIDDLGHAGNVRWVQWVNDAAAAHSGSVGLDLAAYRRAGVVWVVRRHEIDYLAEAREGQTLDAVTWVESLKGATSLRRTLFERDGATLAHAATTWVLLSIATGRPTRIPKDLLSRYGFGASS